MSTTDLKIPGASIYPSSGPRRWLPTPDGHRLPPLRDLIAAHDSTTRKSNFLLNAQTPFIPQKVRVKRKLAYLAAAAVGLLSLLALLTVLSLYMP